MKKTEQMNTEEKIQDENRKIRHVRLLVDFTGSMLMQAEMSVTEMFSLIQATRNAVLAIFPEKEAVFDLIYKPRFERIIQERLKSN